MVKGEGSKYKLKPCLHPRRQRSPKETQSSEGKGQLKPLTLDQGQCVTEINGKGGEAKFTTATTALNTVRPVSLEPAWILQGM